MHLPKIQWMGLFEGFSQPSSQVIPVQISKTYSSIAVKRIIEINSLMRIDMSAHYER